MGNVIAAGKHVVVVGGGLLGLCSAHFLREAGHEVTLLERRENIARETSFANGGLQTPSMSDPWNAPGIHWQLLRWLGRNDAPMLLRASAIPGYLGWGLGFLANSTVTRHLAAMRANFALSSFSLAATQSLCAKLGIDYGLGARGSLKVFRDRATFDVSAGRSGQLRDLGLEFELLDRDGVVRLEPCLAEIRDAIVGGIYYPVDEVGDPYRFCTGLGQRLVERGVAIENDREALELDTAGGAVRGVITSRGSLTCDAVVVAAAAWSQRLCGRAGVRVAIRPVKGYSLTMTVDDSSLLPSRPVIDDDLHAAASPVGGRLRLAGTAEFCGWDASLDPARLATLWSFLAALSPTLDRRVDRQAATAWCGFRPVSADGRPWIGATAVPGLYVNTGHGHLGWTQAVGSAALLAQLMAGAPPAIDPRPYGVERRWQWPVSGWRPRSPSARARPSSMRSRVPIPS